MPPAGFALLGFLLLCLLVAAASGAVTATSVHGWFRTLARPPLSPPDWVFGPAWSTLYTLMAVAAWLVWRLQTPASYRALRLWGWQLAANALWTPAFFGLRSTTGGLLAIVPMLVMVGWTTLRFWGLHRVAGLLMVPYLGWTVFAGYLALGFFVLNAWPG